MFEDVSHKKCLNVGILADGFITWGGGVDLIKSIIRSLEAIQNEYNIRIYLLVPDGISYQTRRKLSVLRASFIYSSKITNLTVLKKLAIKLLASDRTYNLFDKSKNVNLVTYKHSNKCLLGVVNRLKIDIIVPSIKNLGKNFGIPWVGYIPDLQHLHLKNNFTDKERENRDKVFQDILFSAKVVVVNSRFVKDDLENNYETDAVEIIAMPFAPNPVTAWLECSSKVSEPWACNGNRYFIISNQFWMHKSHETAFKSLQLLLQNGHRNIYIVCTGSQDEYRDAGYYDSLLRKVHNMGLSNNIHFLGHLDKLDQIRLIKGSVALIQPTLFEGGPGGGSVYDALSVGAFAIVSDITVNMEIEGERVIFFKSNSPKDLAAKMSDLLEKETITIDKNKLIHDGNVRAEKLGKKVMKAAYQALKYQQSTNK